MTTKNPALYLEDQLDPNAETLWERMYPRVVERGPVSIFRRYTPDQQRKLGMSGWIFDKKEIGWQLVRELELPDNSHNGSGINADWAKYTLLDTVERSIDFGPSFSGLTSYYINEVSNYTLAIDTYEPCGLAVRKNIKQWRLDNVEHQVLECTTVDVLDKCSSIEWESFDLIRLGTLNCELILKHIQHRIQAKYIILGGRPTNAIIEHLKSSGYDYVNIIQLLMNSEHKDTRGIHKLKTLPAIFQKTK